MLVVVLLSATLFQHVAAAPEPIITAAAVLHQREKREMSSRLAVARQLNPYLEMCYGGENSICDIYLDKDCPTDMDNWYQCICETGYLAAEFASMTKVTFLDAMNAKMSTTPKLAKLMTVIG
ncbi:hypothetical protein ACEPPN_004019 [Leptodophora sp. 'Broadleaf-Isolate-01']